MGNLAASTIINHTYASRIVNLLPRDNALMELAQKYKTPADQIRANNSDLNSLSRIAAKAYRQPDSDENSKRGAQYWLCVYYYNVSLSQDKRFSNPNVIQPGQVFFIPPAEYINEFKRMMDHKPGLFAKVHGVPSRIDALPIKAESHPTPEPERGPEPAASPPNRVAPLVIADGQRVAPPVIPGAGQAKDEAPAPEQAGSEIPLRVATILEPRPGDGRPADRAAQPERIVVPEPPLAINGVVEQRLADKPDVSWWSGSRDLALRFMASVGYHFNPGGNSENPPEKPQKSGWMKVLDYVLMGKLPE